MKPLLIAEKNLIESLVDTFIASKIQPPGENTWEDYESIKDKIKEKITDPPSYEYALS